MRNVYQKHFISVCLGKLKKIPGCHFLMAAIQNPSSVVNLGLKRASYNFSEVEFSTAQLQLDKSTDSTAIIPVPPCSGKMKRN